MIGASQIGDMLVNNTGITHLTLSMHHFGVPGAIMLAEGLGQNTALTVNLLYILSCVYSIAFDI